MSPSESIIRFADFEVDLPRREVRKKGLRIRLDGQPLRVLEALLEHHGEVVTRDQLKTILWPEGTFVEFDRGLNEAVKRLREALDDSAEKPRFIETVRGRGYRFVYPVQQSRTPGRQWLLIASVLAICVILAIVGATYVLSMERRQTPAGMAEVRSIAVLPLVNLSEDRSDDEIADGMTAALIAELARITSIRVISRQSVMQYENTEKSIGQIADELDVDAIIAGTILREENRVSVTAQLHTARPERQLWSKQYSRNPTSLLLLHEEIARGIAREIQGGMIEQIASPSTTEHVAPEAYDAYLRGLFYTDRVSSGSIHRSIDHFQRAIEVDPMFAQAWAGLSDAYNRAVIQHQQPSLDAYPIAKAATLNAIRLDPDLADAHLMAGVINFRFDWDWEAAESELKRALSLNPNHSRIRLGYGTYLLAMGRIDESIEQARKAVELDPVNPQRHMDLGWKYSLHGQHDRAIKSLRMTVTLKPDIASAHALLSMSLAKTGQPEEAVASCERALNLADDADTQSYCARAFTHLGRDDAALTILENLRAEPDPAAYRIAQVADSLGDIDEAIKWLDRAVSDKAPEVCFLRVDRWSDRLRSHPRYQELLGQMRFPS